jgi:hypothetical protein
MGDAVSVRERLDGKAARETQNFRGPCEPGFSRAESVDRVESISIGA